MLSRTGIAVLRSASRTWIGVSSGRADRISAADPPVNGVESEVPLMLKYEENPEVEAQAFSLQPGEVSRFVRPSFVGPVELKPASCREKFTAPTETMLSASAGVSIVATTPSPFPSFPIASQTTTPSLAA